ncbi:hypothetical protein AURDEDRAFT_165601 [Auricularia subglabra TFB-10046 SS5]|nr:hypothetical protein AURDEDRAFT_165601 [Auricularia subglabra TFB-10046 SS5]
MATQCADQGPFDSGEPLVIGIEAFEAGIIKNQQHSVAQVCERPDCPLGCNDPESELSGDDSSDDEWPPQAPSARKSDSKAKPGSKKKNKQNPRTRDLKKALNNAATGTEKRSILIEDLKRRNDRLLRKAFSNLTCCDISLRELVELKKAGKSRKWPQHPGNVVWGSTKPHLAVDKDDVPLAVHIPNFLGGRGNKRLYRLLRRFGRDMAVRPRRGAADAKKRDNLNAYIFRSNKKYLSGVVQLVAGWTAIGHPNDEAVPASDVLKTGASFRTAMGCIRDLAFVSSLIDDVLRKLDPAAYDVLREGRHKLRRHNPAYAAISSLDPTYLHGRSISFNRATPDHEDCRDPPEVLTPLLVVGKFKTGGELVIEKLGLRMSYLPGTLIFIRGAVLPHQVKVFSGGQRISIAHFVHKAVLAQVGITEIPLTARSRSQYATPIVLRADN